MLKRDQSTPSPTSRGGELALSRQQSWAGAFQPPAQSILPNHKLPPTARAFPTVRAVFIFKISCYNLADFMGDELQKLKQELHKKDFEIKQLKELGTKDPLTGLFNRRGFEEEVTHLIKDVAFVKENPEARKHFYIDSISILFFDIDNFKKINDTYGHKAGDQILQQVSQIIRQKVRSIDFIGRWGGEELVVALVGSHEDDAYRKAEEIRKAIRSRVKVKETQITISSGVAEFEDGLSFEALVKGADKAMYEAKHNRGKDNVVKFSELK